jgi:xylan 1,4-beta-xylosidase
VERAAMQKNDRHLRHAILLGLLVSWTAFERARCQDAFPVSIQVDASDKLGELKPIWRFFGGDEPNYATMKNGRKLIGELGQMSPKSVFFRTHNLLCTGDGTPALKWGSSNAYREDADGKPIYDWTIVDKIFDTYLENGVRPYVQIGFMPKDLSTRPDPYQHDWKPGDDYGRIFTGWAYPPDDYEKWGELAYQWTMHCIERYGRDEVEKWYWQVWNEANIGYWRGTPQEFLKLHDFAIAGVRRALPTAKVGGADTAGDGGRFTRRFIEHCLRGTNHATGQTGTPLDFVSFHAKGAPNYVDGHVRMGIANQLRTIDAGFRIIASYPETKGLPIVIGESDPDGCAACNSQVYPQNNYRNGTLYASYTAASFARKHDLARGNGVNLEGALTWAFEFEDQPYFAGYRTLATNGIDKPVLNVFRMFSHMRGERIGAESDHAVPLERIMRRGVRERPDVAALASQDETTLAVMVWHYHDDDVPGPAANVELTVRGLPESADALRMRHFRIDEEHSNSFTAWKKMGSPQEPSAEQYAELEKAGQLAELETDDVQADGGAATVKISLPRQAVSLLVFELPTAAEAEAASANTGVRKIEPVPAAIREKFELDPFYQKHVDAGGLPILSSSQVSDAGLLEAAHLIDQMLANREDLRQELIKRRVRFVVMAPTEMTTDVPEQAHMDSEYWDRRARGLGGRICSCGEENLLNLKGDRYSNENILIHEFSHTIHNFGLRRLDAEFNSRLQQLYDEAMKSGLWENTYAATNPEEYWAEAVQSYFDCNAPPRRRVHNDVDTREELKDYDPKLFALIDESFKSPPWRYQRYDERNAGGGN